MLSASMPYSHSVTSHYTCDVHKLATVQTPSLQFINSHTTALIAGSLALSEAGTLRGLRQSLLSVLRERVRVLYAEPPQDPLAENYRQAVLDALLPLAAAKEGHSVSSKVGNGGRALFLVE